MNELVNESDAKREHFDLPENEQRCDENALSLSQWISLRLY